MSGLEFSTWERTVPLVRDPAGRPPRLPGQVASTFAQLPFVQRATVEQRRNWYDAIRLGHEAAKERRARVLAHPDLANRLRAIGYRDPANWSGYVPPSSWSGHHNWQHNDSPTRAVLLEVLRAVAEREAAGD